MQAYKRKCHGGVSPGLVVMCILIGFIGVILISNTNVFLSKMGFETTTTLKGELVNASKDLEEAIRVNQHNLLMLKQERDNARILKEELTTLQEVKHQAGLVVTEVNSRKVRKTVKTLSSIKENTIVDQDTVTLPRQELDTLSSANIDQLHETHSRLFNPTDNHS